MKVCQNRSKRALTQVNNPHSVLFKTKKFWSKAFLRVNKLVKRACSKGKCSHFPFCSCEWKWTVKGESGSWPKSQTQLLWVQRARRPENLEELCVLCSSVFFLLLVLWLYLTQRFWDRIFVCKYTLRVDWSVGSPPPTPPLGRGGENYRWGTHYWFGMLLQLRRLKNKLPQNSMVLKQRGLF